MTLAGIDGLKGELLPIVCRLDAEISERSSIGSIGKIPSEYNNQKKVRGFHAWANKTSTESEVVAWSKNSDYGISLQTRKLRAFDLDIDDAALAQEVRDMIEVILGPMPARVRENSPRVLLAAFMDGDLRKHEIAFPDGSVLEILGNGQQFQACGMHPSGVRYEWEDGTPKGFPTIQREDFDMLIDALLAAYPEANLRKGRSERKRGQRIDLEDPVEQCIRDNDLDLETYANGNIAVRCPNHAAHTSDGNLSSTVWMPAGTEGHGVGHFRCLHSHCSSLTREDYLQHLSENYGFAEGQDDFSMIVAAPTAPPPMPVLNRNNNGAPLATLPNLTAMLGSQRFSYQIGYDDFRATIMIRELRDEKSAWRPLVDEDITEMRQNLERAFGFRPVGKEIMRDAVHLIARDNRFDSAIEHLNSLTWDKVPRVTNFLRDCFGAEDSDYVRACSEYVWTALAGRTLKPGLKVDMALILTGVQGTGKSTGIEAIAQEDCFAEMSFHEKDDDLARRLRGKQVVEIGELRGLHTRELEGIKAYLTRTTESWVPKYQEFATSFPRRMVFFGTTNESEFLSDETGNRRWLPLRSTYVDVDCIRLNRDQLWAEAAHMFNRKGLLYKEAERLARFEHKEFSIVDVWEDKVQDWLESYDHSLGFVPSEAEYLQLNDVLSNALDLPPGRVKHFEKTRLGKVLVSLGYQKKVRSIPVGDGDAKAQRKVWVKADLVHA